MPNVIDLFAGAGGLSLGAARAGFNVAAAVEIDSSAIESHRINFPNTTHIQKDILTLDGENILVESKLEREELAGIIGGPPCQGFSTIGYGDVTDDRNRLFIKFFQIIAELRPIFFVAENVPGIMREKYDQIRNEAFKFVDDYTILPPISVTASEYGAPTTRTRYFFIGYLDDGRIHPFDVGDIEDSKVPIEQRTNVRQALEGLPSNIQYNENSSGIEVLSQNYCDPNALHIQSAFFYERTTNLIPLGVGDMVYANEYRNNHCINGCLPTKHTQKVIDRYVQLECGHTDKISRSKRLKPEGYCPTIRAGTGPEKGSYQAVRPVHYDQNRVITPREAARLQGFPDWYRLPDTIWHSFRQIGNSVSPIAAERILSVVFRNLQDEN